MKAIWNDQIIAEADKDDLIYIERTWYFPPSSVKAEFLQKSTTPYTCPWKGVCQYFDVTDGKNTSSDNAWSYPEPSHGFREIGGYLAFYASRVDECWVDDERVQPQVGDFYGGWITSRIVGPFKGAAGTSGW